MDERLVELGSRPIAGDAPVGVEAKYDEEYEKLMSEVVKLEAVSVDSPIDWEVINDIAILILDSKSKDLLIACYLAHGLYLKQGMDGLLAGLQVINDMLSTYYDGLFPPVKRVKARANALYWLAEKTEPLIAALDPKFNQLEVFAGCLSQLNAIQDVCDEKMQDKGPPLGALKRTLKNWRDHLQTEADKQGKQAQAASAPAKVAAPAVAAKPAEKSAAAIAPVAPIGELGGDQDVRAAVKSIQDVGKKVAAFKRQKNSADPGAYSLLRTSIWMQVERLPPSENGVTQLPELEPDRQKFMQNQLESKAYIELLSAAENAFIDSMFWLNAHRLVATALDGLGHELAKKAVVNAVVAFVSAFPGIMDLKFVSGTPFADEMTKLWIEEQLQGGGSEGGGGTSGGSAWQAATQSALSLAAKGKFEDGLGLMQAGILSACDDRERFMWQLSRGQFFEKTGKVQLAVPNLEHLWNQMLICSLTEWDLSSSLIAAKSLSACYSNKGFSKEMNEERKNRAAELKYFIYRHDVEAALLLEAK
jgi:type VI secretion system protein VasJ